MASAGKRRAGTACGSGTVGRAIVRGLTVCWALAAGIACAADAGPTWLFYVRSPKALWDGLASLAPSDEAAEAMRGLPNWTGGGLDLERPLGVRVEFDESEAFYYRVAIPTKNGAEVLEWIAPFLPGLRKANLDGSRDFAGGVVQARDGNLFFATDEDRLKDLRGAASLLPAHAPDADVLASFRPRTIPGFLRRAFLDGMEEEFKKALAKADAVELPALPFEEGTEKTLETPEARRLKQTIERTLVRHLRETMRRLLLDTEELSLTVRVRERSLEVEWTQRLPADLPETRRFEERAAPSRFAAWDTPDASSFIGESISGSKTFWTTLIRDEITHFLKNPPAADAEPPQQEFLPFVPLLPWAEKYLTDGARDWACAVRRVEGDRIVMLFGVADPRLGEIGPLLSKLQAEIFSRHADKIEFKPAAWKEGEFVVNLLVPVGLLGPDAKADEEFRRLYGKKPEIAVAFGPDRILVVVGEDCRGRLRTAIEETARPRETREPFRLRVNPVAEMRRSLVVMNELDILSEAHKARLKALLTQAPDAEADTIDLRTRCDGLTQAVTFRFGHTLSKTFALIAGAGVEQGIQQGLDQAKAAAEGN